MHPRELRLGAFRPNRIWCALAASLLLVGSNVVASGSSLEEPPRSVHLPFEEIRFTNASLQSEYEQRCGADLAGMAKFSRSAFAAEQVLEGGGGRSASRTQLKLNRSAVRLAVVDHRDARDSLFKCLAFLETIAAGGDAANAVVSNKAIKLHQGSMTTIDGRIIHILIRLEKFEF